MEFLKKFKRVLTDPKEKSRFITLESSHSSYIQVFFSNYSALVKPFSFQGAFLLTMVVKICYLRLSVSSNQFSSKHFQQQGVFPTELLLSKCFFCILGKFIDYSAGISQEISIFFKYSNHTDINNHAMVSHFYV